MTLEEFCDAAQHRFPGVDPSTLSRSEKRAILAIYTTDFLPRVKLVGHEAIAAYVEWCHQHRELVRAVARGVAKSSVNERYIARRHAALLMRAEKLTELVTAADA